MGHGFTRWQMVAVRELGLGVFGAGGPTLIGFVGGPSAEQAEMKHKLSIPMAKGAYFIMRVIEISFLNQQPLCETPGHVDGGFLNIFD